MNRITIIFKKAIKEENAHFSVFFKQEIYSLIKNSEKTTTLYINLCSGSHFFSNYYSLSLGSLSVGMIITDIYNEGIDLLSQCDQVTFIVFCDDYFEKFQESFEIELQSFLEKIKDTVIDFKIKFKDIDCRTIAPLIDKGQIVFYDIPDFESNQFPFLVANQLHKLLENQNKEQKKIEKIFEI